MHFQKKQLNNKSEIPSTMDYTIDFDPSKPRFSNKFSFVKFLNKKENEHDCLDECLEYLQGLPSLKENLFCLGVANWKPNTDDKNFQLVFNKKEQLIITFEGTILNRQFLQEFLLVSTGKIKEVLLAQSSKNLEAESGGKQEGQSDEELLLNLYKFFLNDCFCDQKAFRKLVGIINGPVAISIFNKKQPERLLCFWRDIPIFLHGEPLTEASSDQPTSDSSFMTESRFSSISLCTFRSETLLDTCPFPPNEIHSITLLPHHEIKIDSIGQPINITEFPKNLHKKETINIPKNISEAKSKSNLRLEIFEQPRAMQRLLRLSRNRLESLDTFKLDFMEGFEDYFSPQQRLIITGCGSSYFAGCAGADFLRKMGLFRDVRVVNSVEFDLYAFANEDASISNRFGQSSVDDVFSRVLLPKSEMSDSKSNSIPLIRQIPQNVCVAVTQSGESSDVLNFMKKMKSRSCYN